MRHTLHEPDDPQFRARRTMRGLSAEIPPEFDPAAWAALLEEQRVQIARVAGVDPSKVRIHVGH